MTASAATLDLKEFIRDIPDFPKKGIVFKDITPLLGAPKAFAAAVDRVVEHYASAGIQKVAGIEARGFLFAGAVAQKLDAGVIPIRKKGKLPYKTLAAEYALEYGTDTVEIHEDAAAKDEKVLLIDDLIATGGTAQASCELLEKTGACVAGVCFIIELGFLKGREKLAGRDIFALIDY